MKKTVLKSALSLTLSALLFFSCACGKKGGDSMKVVRDCTGTYLRFNEKDYHVCNLGKLEGFADGQTVNASFKKIKDCHDKSQPEIVCMMFHENEGWIKVLNIR